MPLNGSADTRKTNALEPTEEFIKIAMKQAVKKGLLFSERKSYEKIWEDEKITVENVELEANGTIGENYGSSMTFVNVKIRTPEGIEDIGIVTKNLKKTRWHVEIMNIFLLFEKEVEFFNKTLPAITQFQARRGVPKPITDIVPNCLFAKVKDGQGMIITENLCKKGFKMAERRRGLGLNHSKLVMEALARFHAASLTMKVLDPAAYFDAIENSKIEAYFTEDRKFIYDHLYKKISKGKILSMVQEEIEKGASDAEMLLKMAEVGEEILRNRGQLTMDMLTNYREPFAVFNHGDFWVNNIMFRYEKNNEGETIPVSVKILDFQMTRYGSPALDMLTFLYTSTTRELREAHGEKLLRIYHNNLMESIREAGIDPVSQFQRDKTIVNSNGQTDDQESSDLPDDHPLSFSNLKEELRRHGSWALMIAEMMLRFVMADSSEAGNAMEATILDGRDIHEEEEEPMAGFDMLRKLTTQSYFSRFFEVFRELVHKRYL